MLASKPKSTGSLERAVSRYEAKLARAINPTQRNYAAGMLRMAQAALADARDGEPAVEPDGPDVVTLAPGEYQAR